LRDARLRLLADDLHTLRETLDREIADETALRARREEVEAEVEAINERLAALEAQHAADAPVPAEAQDTWYQLSTPQERSRPLPRPAAERPPNLSAAPVDERPGRAPNQLTAEADKVREQEEELRAALEASQERLAEAVERRQDLERRLAFAEKAIVA